MPRDLRYHLRRDRVLMPPAFVDPNSSFRFVPRGRRAVEPFRPTRSRSSSAVTRTSSAKAFPLTLRATLQDCPSTPHAKPSAPWFASSATNASRATRHERTFLERHRAPPPLLALGGCQHPS